MRNQNASSVSHETTKVNRDLAVQINSLAKESNGRESAGKILSRSEYCSSTRPSTWLRPSSPCHLEALENNKNINNKKNINRQLTATALNAAIRRRVVSGVKDHSRTI